MSYASPETLMRQAGYTSEEWMRQAVKSIDSQFDEGYAKKNPALVGAFIQGAGLDQIAAYLNNISDMIGMCEINVDKNDDDYGVEV